MNAKPFVTIVCGLILSIGTWSPRISAQESPSIESAFPPAGDEPEVLNRGPIHEAFATPGTNQPIESPLVAKAPPAAIDELPPNEKPEGENVEWIGGYWAFDDVLSDFIWISGVWREVPPGRQWVPGYWSQVDAKYQWVPGMWLEGQADQLEYLPAPPPSQERGPSSPAPADDCFYIPGSWVYSGNNYRWRTGYWTTYQPDRVWVPARYVATPVGFVFVSGYWDYPLASRGLLYAPTYFRVAYTRPYTPRIAVNCWDSFFVHLFVRPSCGTYVFGNYYDPTYASMGIVPWCQYGRTRTGIDPFYGYYGWRYGHDFHTRCSGWNQYYAANPNSRPHATLREELHFAQQHPDHNHRRTQLTVRAQDLGGIANQPISLAKIDDRERERAKSQNQRMQSLEQARIVLEKRPTTKFDGKLDGSRLGKADSSGSRGSQTRVAPTEKITLKLPGIGAVDPQAKKKGDSSSPPSGSQTPAIFPSRPQSSGRKPVSLDDTIPVLPGTLRRDNPVDARSRETRNNKVDGRQEPLKLGNTTKPPQTAGTIQPKSDALRSTRSSAKPNITASGNVAQPFPTGASTGTSTGRTNSQSTSGATLPGSSSKTADPGFNLGSENRVRSGESGRSSRGNNNPTAGSDSIRSSRGSSRTTENVKPPLSTGSRNPIGSTNDTNARARSRQPSQSTPKLPMVQPTTSPNASPQPNSRREGTRNDSLRSSGSTNPPLGVNRTNGDKGQGRSHRATNGSKPKEDSGNPNAPPNKR